MGYFEINLFYVLRAKLGNKVAQYFWKFYRRYLDDGIIFWDKRLGDFDDIFIILNQINPSLKFTLDRDFNRLKFSKVLIYKTAMGLKLSSKGKTLIVGIFNLCQCSSKTV